ncbi:hypothetical protein Goari_000889 [Gossypium aridum]|uniref:Uncharacterized protein n=1 Tax=Gossypium aridum TaxID=34290 RepID=A0A7J8YI34_GOSAI|nr:hypothetical protein [Gossypium aridum]
MKLKLKTASIYEDHSLINSNLGYGFLLLFSLPLLRFPNERLKSRASKQTQERWVGPNLQRPVADEEERLLPIAKMRRIMKGILPPSAKI